MKGILVGVYARRAREQAQAQAHMTSSQARWR